MSCENVRLWDSLRESGAILYVDRLCRAVAVNQNGSCCEQSGSLRKRKFCEVRKVGCSKAAIVARPLFLEKCPSGKQNED